MKIQLFDTTFGTARRATDWLLHVRRVLGTTPEENLAMIRDSVGFLKRHGREVVYDAEHFFDGFRADRDYALQAVSAAAEAGADWVVLCDTNGGSLPSWVTRAGATSSRRRRARSSSSYEGAGRTTSLRSRSSTWS